jgi:hypothetical protein
MAEKHFNAAVLLNQLSKDCRDSLTIEDINVIVEAIVEAKNNGWSAGWDAAYKTQFRGKGEQS